MAILATQGGIGAWYVFDDDRIKVLLTVIFLNRHVLASKYDFDINAVFIPSSAFLRIAYAEGYSVDDFHPHVKEWLSR